MHTRNFAVGFGILAVLVLSCGCRNPFDPQVDIELERIFVGSQFNPEHEIAVRSTETTPPIDFTIWIVNVDFLIRNKVGVTLRSINIVYTDSDNNPVTVFDADGRTFKILARLDPLQDTGFGAYGSAGSTSGEGRTTTIRIFVVDANVITAFQSPTYPIDKVMFATLTFRGVDDNGYDVKLSGRITIKAFGPV